jgi:hypothetical protein
MLAQRSLPARSSRRSYAGPERRAARPSPAAIFAALAVFGAIAFATLCPPELRPHLGGADEERFGAYFLLGGCMAFAFPRRANLVVFAVAGIACTLEAGQLLVPGRDAAFSDACVKAMGGLWGAFAAQSSYGAMRWLRRRRPRSRLIYGR